MTATQVENSFRRQISRYKPRASFKKNVKLIFKRHLQNANRAILWVHKDRHEEVERLADATGLTMSVVTDTLIRFALSNAVVIDDEGKDVELREYLDAILGAQSIVANVGSDAQITDSQDSEIKEPVE